MDPVVLVSLITSISSMVVSILTHIRYSKCGMCEVQTKDDSTETNRSRSNSSRSSFHDISPPTEKQPLIQG